jgi:hypothetical protein
VKRRSIQPLVTLLSVLSFAAFSVACTAEEERRPPPSRPSDDDGGVRLPPERVVFGPCTDGDTQECSIILGVHNDIVSCFHGVQACTDGVWGMCTDGMQIEVASEDLPGIVGSGSVMYDGGVSP